MFLLYVNDKLLYKKTNELILSILNPYWSIYFFSPTIKILWNEEDDYDSNIYKFSLNASTLFNFETNPGFQKLQICILGFGFYISKQTGY